MNWLVYHIVSGHAFFTGAFLLVAAAVLSKQTRPMFRRLMVISFLVGAIAVSVSSTAIPNWYYGIAAVITLLWIVSRYKKQWSRGAAYAFAGVWFVAALMELPYHVTPSLRPAPTRAITIIGDSVTAGVGGGDTSERWPSILAREHELQVQDISHMGETAASALKRVKSHSIESSVVLVEIGGNDLLGTTTSSQFGQDLDALLAHLTRKDAQVMMFELPLPAFYHEYGRVQRTLAAKHHVKLVPKRVFLSVIAGSNSTLDSIHLSASGHKLMADCVWRLVQSAFDSHQGTSP
jgi:acyl-CoA thioesterase-1